MKNSILCYILIGLLYAPQLVMGQQLVSIKVDQAPAVDGKDDEDIWSRTKTLSVHDPIAAIDIQLKSVYTDEWIFLLVKFPDETENRAHKTLNWNKDLGVYRTGFKREDTFLLKWSMEPYPVDLSIAAEKPYKADIWYWKAHRTDPVGYADDKMHVYGARKTDTAKKLLSRSGQRFYLDRPGDAGESAYETQVYEEYMKDDMPRYRHRQPQGSRADVRAKGVWADGRWTIEFSRKLDTAHVDDVQFDPALNYQFGVSRYEIAGKRPNPKLEQPNYESGEIGEQLSLIFE